MLRPTLVLAGGLAASPSLGLSVSSSLLSDAHVTVAAVAEMVHMATLVHDDVLDEADTRRRARTVNRLHGNETAVILGDYLIAAAYHLCSQLDSQDAALLIGRVSMTVCSGELLQLAHRADFSLDEPTYFEIVERKTASLIGAACRLGARCSGADEQTCARLERFGRDIGVAFQIQDDVLDLTGREARTWRRASSPSRSSSTSPPPTPPPAASPSSSSSAPAAPTTTRPTPPTASSPASSKRAPSTRPAAAPPTWSSAPSPSSPPSPSPRPAPTSP
jgi:octaprenyl-diphosphate synthase